MRIAVLADIHGNLPALEAALAEVERLRVDRVVIAGDVAVGSPDSLACWGRVKALNCPVLRGNHERYVCDLGTERGKAEWLSPQFGPVQYAAKQLGDANRRELAGLPLTLRLTEAPDLLFVHASARNDTDLVFPYTRDAQIAPMFEGVSEKWIVRGHNHYAGVYLRTAGQAIVTTGSVGLPLDGTPKAQFVVFERQAQGDAWCFEHHAVAYDLARALRRFVESGYLAAAGPMARLYQREVETAAFHILPFLKFRSEAEQHGETWSLEEAVEEFFRR